MADQHQTSSARSETARLRARDRAEYPRGESMVWFTSMGLAIGIIMIVALLGVIVVNGLSVFWPKTIYEFTLAESAAYRGSQVVAGSISMQREKRLQGDTTERIEELQLFLGNKQQYGQMYRFFDEASIAGVERASGILRMERLEWGDAVGYPLRLVFGDGSEVAASDDSFARALDDAVAQSTERRAAFMRIEEVDIGRINRKMEKLRLERRFIETKEEVPADDQERISEIEAGMAELQVEFDTFNTEAKRLRAMQQENILVYRLATGEEVSLPVGEIVHAYAPNELGFFEKIGFFFGRVWGFITEEPREANTEGGIFPAIFGTFVMTVLMSIAVMPFGVIAAVYLREYAKQGALVRSVRIAINNLAGVPSIVYGVFGLGFFVYFVGGGIDELFFSRKLPTPTFGTGGILWASLTLALMTVPVVVVATEEALSAVPRGIREASLACGASKWQTIQRLVLPAAAPGMLTGLILAMARGAGEVAPLMLVGVVKLAPSLPVDGIFPFFHLERKFMHLGFHIYDLGFQSPDSDAARPMVFATTLLLIVLVVVLNLAAISIRNHLRRKYKGDTF